MKIENQVCDLSQAMVLKTFGVLQKSLFYHHLSFDRPVFGETPVTETGKQYKKTQVCNDKKGAASAYTVLELAAMVGKGSNAASLLYDAVQARMNHSHSFTICYSPKFLANCIIGMLQTGRITAEEINQRLLKA